MIRRMFFVILFPICYPIVVACYFFGIIILGPIACVRWIIFDNEDASDLILIPAEWAMNLPWLISGNDK